MPARTPADVNAGEDASAQLAERDFQMSAGVLAGINVRWRPAGKIVLTLCSPCLCGFPLLSLAGGAFHGEVDRSVFSIDFPFDASGQRTIIG